MKNGHRNLLLACVIAIVGLLIWFYWPHKPEPSKSSTPVQRVSPSPVPSTSVPSAKVNASDIPTDAEIKQRNEQQIRSLFQTPIAVFGKVVDENGNPLPGAKVEIGINDKPMETGSTYNQLTDAEGLFSLTGVRGIAFSVSASKSGYYETDKSTGHRNVVVPTEGDTPQPTKDQPVILVLRKQGQTEPLFFVSSRQIDVPRSGQPLSIDLATGRTGQGSLQVLSWIGDSSQRPFDWRYQLSVPGGGLVERKGQFDFEAPTDGYQTSVEINMPPPGERWTARAEKQYFAKLADGRYVRFLIRFYPGQRNFVVIESYVNPTPGSRNLEFDPAKSVKSP